MLVYRRNIFNALHTAIHITECAQIRIHLFCTMLPIHTAFDWQDYNTDMPNQLHSKLHIYR